MSQQIRRGRGRRGRRRGRRNNTLQLLLIIVALVATVGLLIGYKLGYKDDQEETSPNIGDSNTQITTTISPTSTTTVTPTISPTVTPIVTPTVTPTVAPTVTISPEPTLTIAPTDSEDSPKMVALTFDDGPYPPVTKRILETLKKNDAKATFFMMGNRMTEYKSTVELVYEDGNQIGSHTYSHKDLTKLSKKELKYEVDYASECINNVVPVGDVFLRPPYGAKNDFVKANVGAPMIFWSVDSLDWSSRKADAVYKEIMDHVQDGDIIIMHDLYESTADAMEIVIPKLIEEGYHLVTVKELLEAKGIDIVDGNAYYYGR